MSASSDLQLLVTALQTNGEAEADGVKFIYMDDSTVYRFENNRMKKVSQTMLKKANKLLAQQNSIPSQSTEAPKRQRKAKQQAPPPPPADNEEEEDVEESQPAPPPPPAPKRQRKPKQPQSAPATAMSSNIDLNEYWQVKNRNEYMNTEIERLNHKVSKLKQYKNIVTRLTGGEYDVDVPQQLPQQQQQQQPQQIQSQRTINDSLFMF